MPAAQSRRRFLSQAAGVAAGGAVLALATVSATADAAAPMASLAFGELRVAMTVRRPGAFITGTFPSA
jgi:hypothetical protein